MPAEFVNGVIKVNFLGKKYFKVSSAEIFYHSAIKALKSTNYDISKIGNLLSCMLIIF